MLRICTTSGAAHNFQSPECRQSFPASEVTLPEEGCCPAATSWLSLVQKVRDTRMSLRQANGPLERGASLPFHPVFPKPQESRIASVQLPRSVLLKAPRPRQQFPPTRRVILLVGFSRGQSRNPLGARQLDQSSRRPFPPSTRARQGPPPCPARKEGAGTSLHS